MRILLVEDNPGDARLIRIKLGEYSDFPFEFTRTENLGDALTELDESFFDVVLLDLNLPDTKGKDTFEKLRSHTIGVPVVVLTGYGEETMGQELVQGGAQDYLVKGQIEGHTLARSLRYAVERHTIMEALKEEKKDNELYLDIMSHDIHNLNWAITTRLEIVVGREDVPDNVMEHVLAVLEQTRTIASLLTMVRLRSSLRGGTLPTQQHDMQVLLDRAKELVEYMYPTQDVDIAISLPDGPVEVTGNWWLLDILVNLIDNSVRFSGKVDPRIEVTCRPCDDGKMVQCEFKDNGPGISDEKLRSAFEKPTGEPTESELGIGLYIVKEVIDRLGGDIKAIGSDEDVQGDGTLLSIQFPSSI